MNEHYNEATRNLTEATEIASWNAEDRLIMATIGAGHATVALAHEQRTANLIAAFAAMESPGGATILGQTMSGVALCELIKERLGLK